MSVYPGIYLERVKKTTRKMFRRSGLLFMIGTKETRFETGVPTTDRGVRCITFPGTRSVAVINICDTGPFSIVMSVEEDLCAVFNPLNIVSIIHCDH
jgi:hypothetical protein